MEQNKTHVQDQNVTDSSVQTTTFKCNWILQRSWMPDIWVIMLINAHTKKHKKTHPNQINHTPPPPIQPPLPPHTHTHTQKHFNCTQRISWITQLSANAIHKLYSTLPCNSYINKKTNKTNKQAKKEPPSPKNIKPFPTGYMQLSYFPCNKLFDEPFLVSCPVSITFHKHHQQTDGVFVWQLQREKHNKSLCVCVSTNLKRAKIKTK